MPSTASLQRREAVILKIFDFIVLPLSLAGDGPDAVPNMPYAPKAKPDHWLALQPAVRCRGA